MTEEVTTIVQFYSSKHTCENCHYGLISGDTGGCLRGTGPIGLVMKDYSCRHWYPEKLNDKE